MQKYKKYYNILIFNILTDNCKNKSHYIDYYYYTKMPFLLFFARTPNGVRDGRCQIYHWTHSLDVSSNASPQGVAALRPGLPSPSALQADTGIATVHRICNEYRDWQAARSVGVGNTNYLSNHLRILSLSSPAFPVYGCSRRGRLRRVWPLRTVCGCVNSRKPHSPW